MRSAIGDYTDWLSIRYTPAIEELLPFALVPYLSKGQSALDVGCNAGGVALFLASHGLNVTGIDLNSQAIDVARKQAAASSFGSSLRFTVADITQFDPSTNFDVLLMIRVLTCFPDLTSWKSVLRRTQSLLREGGMLYVHDFLMAKDNEAYRDRYAVGVQQGWRAGNFSVSERDGTPLFVAHHHSRDEVQQIKEGYSERVFDIHESLSMNGNRCTMFEFIGVKS